MPSLKQDLEVVEGALVGSVHEGEEITIKLIDKICCALNIDTKAAREFVKLALANAKLMDRKQRDYGPGNISAFGTFGVTVRMNDKMERLKTLFNKGKRRRAVNESIQDTFRDISNYAIIALMLEFDMWPNE